jgi:hypothetical protein
LKNLDVLNPAIAQPRTFSSTSALLPFLLGVICLPLASAAAPTVPFTKNFLALLCAAQSVLSLFLMVIPRLCHWDWRSRYFGMTPFCVASTALIGVVPWFGIVSFSSLSAPFRLFLFAAYMGSIIWWCRRFVRHYRRVFEDPAMRSEIYHQEEDAIYYLQQADKSLCDKQPKLNQFPPNLVFISSLFAAFCTVPFATTLSLWVGISFVIIFLTIAGFPIVLMCLGLGVRGYLVFYYYPWRLKRMTGKEVYVLMASAANDLRTQQ